MIGLGIAVLVWVSAVVALIAAGKRVVGREVARLVPNLLVLFKGLLRDRRVPLGPKLWLGAAVLWIASPIDLIPEFIPVAGPIDDAIVALLVLRHLAKKTPRNVLVEHWRGNPRTLAIIAGRASA